MTAFRDFGTDVDPARAVARQKLLADCNWVQAHGRQPRHVAHLLAAPVPRRCSTSPDDGTDTPGYPTERDVLVRIWAQDRAPRLEVAGHVVRLPLRRHPHHAQRPHPRARDGLHHAATRPSSPALPVRAGGTHRSCRSTTTLLALLDAAPACCAAIRNARATDCGATPSQLPLRQRRGRRRASNGVIERAMAPEQRLPDRPRRAARAQLFTGIENFVSQDLMASPRAWARSTTARRSTSAPPTRRSSACAAC